MSPIRRVTFLDANGKPIEPAPSRLSALEEEVQGEAAEQDRLVEFGESQAPAPRTASVRTVELPAPVGSAQELTRLRRSNELRERPQRRRRRAATRSRSKARPSRKTGKASKAKRATTRKAAKATASRSRRR